MKKQGKEKIKELTAKHILKIKGGHGDGDNGNVIDPDNPPLN